tara:strand:+ start:2081 stop:2581 length:501 start_codon:yes stop_codon:yes gene_type:complete
MPACNCITQKGIQCTRNAKPGFDRCGQHLKNYCPLIMEGDTNKFSGRRLREHEAKRSIDKVEFNVKALREMQQKRIMEHPGVKSFKNKRKLSNGLYNCPVCNQHVKKLDCAHVGYKIMVGIRKIVTENGKKLNWDTFEMFELVKNLEDESIIEICCATCNKNLEEN